jgi:hypothetical protein
LNTNPNDFYNSYEARLNTIVGHHAGVYVLIKKAFDSWRACNPEGDHDLFCEYLLDNYGLQLTIRPKLSGIDTEHRIVDEAKYLLLVMKFS